MSKIYNKLAMLGIILIILGLILPLKPKQEIKQVNGTIVLPDAKSGVTTGYTHIEYPKGFNKDNCIIISLTSKKEDKEDYWTADDKSYAGSYIGNGGLSAGLSNDFIVVKADKYSNVLETYDVEVKITLMKVGN